MKILTYTLFALLLSANAISVEIPNQFEDGQVTSASQMNENFQALKVEIEALKSQLTSQANNQVNFIGYSEDSMNGGAGFFNMLQACDNSYSGSHICDGADISKSSFNPAAMDSVSGSAWIINGSSSCESWSRSTEQFTGRSINEYGRNTYSFCHETLKVACCK